MLALSDKPGLINELIDFLQKQVKDGKKWAVYDTDATISGKWSFACFANHFDAIDFANEYKQIFSWHEAIPVDDLLFNLKQLSQQKQDHLTGGSTPSKSNTMNENNLEDRKREMKALGFDDKLIADMERNMEKGLTRFELNRHQPGTKGQLTHTIHFKKSAQSDFYYLNKFSVSLTKGQPLEGDQKYMVISPKEKGKPIFRAFGDQGAAIAYFNEQQGTCELAMGKDPGTKNTLAGKENGKVTYVADSFRKAFYVPPVSQTFWRGDGDATGFTASQTANLIEGRAVYRDDMMSMQGMPYKAWITLDFDKPKDRHNNFSLRQYVDPSYGFDLKETLSGYQIKELGDPKKEEKMLNALKNGDRLLITTSKDGEEVKRIIEAVPRFKKINFFTESGRMEKREQFEKAQKPSVALAAKKSKGKEAAQSQGMRV